MVFPGFRLASPRECAIMTLHICRGIDAHVVEAIAQELVRPSRERLVARHLHDGNFSHKRLRVERPVWDGYVVGHRVVLESFSEVNALEILVDRRCVTLFHKHRARSTAQDSLDGGLPRVLFRLHIDKFPHKGQILRRNSQVPGNAQPDIVQPGGDVAPLAPEKTELPGDLGMPLLLLAYFSETRYLFIFVAVQPCARSVRACCERSLQSLEFLSRGGQGGFDGHLEILLERIAVAFDMEQLALSVGNLHESGFERYAALLV